MEYVFLLLKSIVEYSFWYILIEIYLSVFHEVQLKNPAFDSQRELKLLLRLDSLPPEKETGVLHTLRKYVEWYIKGENKVKRLMTLKNCCCQ